MTRSEFLFKLIDVAFHPFQNYRRYPGMTREADFAYDEAFGADCRGEFYYNPADLKSGKKLPVIVNVHGGGFVKGDKSHRRSLCKRYASHGYFVFNINHRLSPKYKFPAGVQDCIKAMNYLAEVADKYNLDLSKVCVTGDSAGAYYATMITAVSFDDALRQKLNVPEVKVKPSVLLSFCGPYDLVASITLTKLPFNLVWDIGRCYLDEEGYALKKDFTNISDYKFLNQLSPINYTNASWCPCFLVMSEKDVFCKGQGELMTKKLKDLGVEVESFSSHKFLDNHCFHMDMGKKISKECFKKAFVFLDKHLK